MLTTQYSGVPAAVRAWARVTPRGWRRAEKRMRRESLRQVAKAGHVEMGKVSKANACFSNLWMVKLTAVCRVGIEPASQGR